MFPRKCAVQVPTTVTSVAALLQCQGKLVCFGVRRPEKKTQIEYPRAGAVTSSKEFVPSKITPPLPTLVPLSKTPTR
jgi:hypothetical protein